MTCATALRDAVTIYEIYLLHGLEELLRRHSKDLAERQTTPPMWKLREFYISLLDIDPGAGAVGEVLDVRNVISHRRGSLRSVKRGHQFVNVTRQLADKVAHMDEPATLSYMDLLGGAVRKLDPVLYVYTWGGRRLKSLSAI